LLDSHFLEFLLTFVSMVYIIFILIFALKPFCCSSRKNFNSLYFLSRFWFRAWIKSLAKT